MDSPKQHNFIVFLIGMFAGRYGIPLFWHCWYLGTIAILAWSLHTR